MFCVLSTNSPATFVRADDAPVKLKGVVVWYQAEKDVR